MNLVLRKPVDQVEHCSDREAEERQPIGDLAGPKIGPGCRSSEHERGHEDPVKATHSMPVTCSAC